MVLHVFPIPEPLILGGERGVNVAAEALEFGCFLGVELAAFGDGLGDVVDLGDAVEPGDGVDCITEQDISKSQACAAPKAASERAPAFCAHSLRRSSLFSIRSRRVMV